MQSCDSSKTLFGFRQYSTKNILVCENRAKWQFRDIFCQKTVVKWILRRSQPGRTMSGLQHSHLVGGNK